MDQANPSRELHISDVASAMTLSRALKSLGDGQIDALLDARLRATTAQLVIIADGTEALIEENGGKDSEDQAAILEALDIFLGSYVLDGRRIRCGVERVINLKAKGASQEAVEDLLVVVGRLAELYNA